MAARSTRWLWILILILLLGLAAQWACNRSRRENLVAEHSAELQRLQRSHAQFVQRWTDALADRSAKALFRAFGAGIQPAVLAGRHEALNQAKNSLLSVNQVAAVHVLTPDGGVLVSSDDKYTTTGSVDERAAWVLETNKITTRPGAAPGILEIAGPIVGIEGPQEFLWISFRRGELLESTRPLKALGTTTAAARPKTAQ